MAATRNDIAGWLARGKSLGATHCIVVCDTFDHDDYPVFVKPGESAQEKLTLYNGKEMQRVMEVYDLTKDLEEQLKPGTRVWNV
jgi:hypothetical protein